MGGGLTWNRAESTEVAVKMHFDGKSSYVDWRSPVKDVKMISANSEMTENSMFSRRICKLSRTPDNKSDKFEDFAV